MNWKERADAIKIYIPALFIALKRSDTPLVAKLLAIITVGYALSPIDLIPDFIPVLGYLDDLIILPLFAAAAVKLIPPEIMAQCQAEAREIWQAGKPQRWYYGIPVLIMWGALVVFIIFKLTDS